MIGCDCDVCTSGDDRDRRTRASIVVNWRGRRLLVDTGPELRLQCVANEVDRIDAVLFTHHHADHVVGLDDLRRFNWLARRPIPCYGTRRTLDALRGMFRYAFEHADDSPHSRPQLELHEIVDGPFEAAGLPVTPLPLMHGPMPVLGFRFSDFAYCTDCNVIPESAEPLLRDLDVLVLDALRFTPHPTHFNLEQAVAAARRVGAGRTYFTHIAHEMAHESTNTTLPENMALAYDGLRIESR